MRSWWNLGRRAGLSSTPSSWTDWCNKRRRRGGIGIRGRFKIDRPRGHAGSSPAVGTAPRWSNGSLGRFRICCPRGREGSNPSLGTTQGRLKIGWARARTSSSLVARTIVPYTSTKGGALVPAPKPMLVGSRFGRWTVVAPVAQRSRNGNAKSLCICDCGTQSIVINGSLRRGTSSSCGCYARERTSLCWGKRLPFGEAARREILRSLKRNAHARNKPFAISDEYINELFNGPCHWCGRYAVNEFSRRNGKTGSFRYNGIDRLDNNHGYIIGNVVSCCGPCNIAKHDMSAADFVTMCKLIASKH